MRLYLVQHAEAAAKTEDPTRSLTAAGKAAAERLATFLARSGRCTPAEIRQSGKRRAQQTAERLAAGLGGGVPVRHVQGLAPLGDVVPLADALAAEKEDLMLVGHLPHLNRLASLLVGGDANAEAFSFANGCLCLERGELGWTVAWMVTPELLG